MSPDKRRWRDLGVAYDLNVHNKDFNTSDRNIIIVVILTENIRSFGKDRKEKKTVTLTVQF